MGALTDMQAQPPAAPATAPQPAPAGPAPGGPQPGMAPAGPQPGAAPGGPQPGAAPGGPQPGAAPGGPEQVDPTAPAVEGTMPAGLSEKPATKEEQKEYERVMKALTQVLYGSDKAADAIVDQVQTQDKVSSTTKAAILLIQQLDERIDMDEVVVAEVTQETTERLIELVENRHGIKYGGREIQVIAASVWEGVQDLFGVEEQDIQEVVSGMDEQSLAQLKQQHEGFLNG